MDSILMDEWTCKKREIVKKYIGGRLVGDAKKQQAGEKKKNKKNRKKR